MKENLELEKLAQLCREASDNPFWYLYKFRDAASPDLIALLVSVAQAAESVLAGDDSDAIIDLRIAIDALRGRVGK